MLVLRIVAALASLMLSAGPLRAADEPDELMPGHVVVLKYAKLAKFVAKPPAGGSFDLPGATNDPTAEGGRLQIFDDDPFNSVGVDFTLPAAGWQALGTAGSKGYRYRGDGAPGNPCRLVLVKAAVVKAVCKGADVFLPTPFTGQAGIVLTVGTDSKRYCALFDGSEVRNDATLLKRRDSPPPGACPLNLVSSTTSVTTTTTSSDSVPASTTSTTLCTDADADTYCAESGDCNDANAAINPGATEVCNGVDDDCDGTTDDVNHNDNPSCTAGPYYLGSLSGDTGAGFLSDSFYDEEFERVTITEDDSGDVYLSATVQLTSPPGIDYDLYVYCESCGGALAGSSTVGGLAGHTDTVDVRRDDVFFGGDDTFDVIIEVRYVSGAACANWNLTVTGNTSVATETCP